MESLLQPPQPFLFENNLISVTSGNLSKEWIKWKKSYQIYYAACELKNKDAAVQINILLHVIGEQGRDVYDQFVGKLDTYEKVLERFDAFFLPKQNLTIERHKFFKRDQSESESVEQYVFELKKMASKCEFKDLCDDLVRDKLICGIRDGSLRERLLREENLTLSKAVGICNLAELSRAQAVTIKTENPHVHEIRENHESDKNFGTAQVNMVQSGRYRSRSSRTRGARGQWPGPARPGPSRMQPERTPEPREFRGRQRVNRSRDQPGWSYTRTYGGCRQCGGVHKRFDCPAYGQQCLRCKKLNHYSRMCGVFEVREDSSDQVIKNIHPDWSVRLQIRGTKVTFKLDTGADVNIIPLNKLKQLNVTESELTRTSIKLHGYSGSELKVVGKCFLKLKYKTNIYILDFLIVDTDSSPILGHSSCQQLNLIKRVFSVNTKNNILDEYSDVFVGLGCLPGTYKIELKDNVTPVVHAPRKLPEALKDKIKSKLTEMQAQGIIAKVEGPTDWVNSMTVVKKPNGDLRICLDPQDLNRAIRREHFKLPTLEEITAKLSKANYFSTLDAKHGFWQVALHESSTDLCTFNTAFGRFKFLRMPYGISSASEIFHRKLYEYFEDIEGVILFVDDLLVYADSKEVHDQRLRAVLDRCKEINIKLNRQKCRVGLTEIKYLGHTITRTGIKPDNSHIIAIQNLPTPTNTKEVERFLGLVTYVGRFVPNLSEKTFMLRELLKKSVEWHWDHHHQECFDNIKKCLVNPPVLQYYSLDKPVVISVDASKHGLGCCLLQNNLPVAYASKSLSKAEQSYAQIEKELFACVFACERFYSYIYGRNDIIIETDHKPLISIINKPLANAPARLQRMLLRLQPYSFRLVYKPGKYLFIADTLSRAVAPGASERSDPRDYLEAQAQVCAITTTNPLTDSHFLTIQKCTADDDEMQKLIKIIKKGWPTHKSEIGDILKPYWDVRDELTYAFGIVWKGNRVVIPNCLRSEMLRKVHIGHLGVEKCKLRAREIMYWPNLNAHLLDYLSRCQTCLTYRKQNCKEPLIQHDVPHRAWSKVGADIFHCNAKSFLLVIDYYSKFIEVSQLQSLQSNHVIRKMKKIFARHGIPEVVMSDNGPEFSSGHFRQFAKDWKFQHVTSSPGYAQSNGQTERAIQSAKNMMKKTTLDGTDFNLALLEYANTPICADLGSPAELLYNRKLRSIVPCAPKLLLPRIHKDTIDILKRRQFYQKIYYDRGAKNLSQLVSGQNVKVWHNGTWMSSTIIKKIGIRSFIVRLLTGETLRRNRRHIIADSKHRNNNSQDSYSLQYDDITSDNAQLIGAPALLPSSPPRAPRSPSTSINNNDTNTNNNYYRTRFGREVRPPDRWGYPATS